MNELIIHRTIFIMCVYVLIRPPNFHNYPPTPAQTNRNGQNVQVRDNNRLIVGITISYD